MRKELKRQFYSWLLLLVFVPTVVAAALHVHSDYSEAQPDCTACVNHQAHAGHISNATGHLHDCVLCQLLQGSFLIASFVVFRHLLFPHRLSFPRLVIDGSCYDGGVLSSRAPPAEMNN